MLKKFGSTYIHIFNKIIENKHADFIILIQKILIILEMSPITLEEILRLLSFFTAMVKVLLKESSALAMVLKERQMLVSKYNK